MSNHLLKKKHYFIRERINLTGARRAAGPALPTQLQMLQVLDSFSWFFLFMMFKFYISMHYLNSSSFIQFSIAKNFAQKKNSMLAFCWINA